MPLAIIAGSDEELKTGQGKLMLTRTQAAARLGVTEKRMTVFVNQNELTPYEEKLFNVPLFPADEIEDFRKRRLKRHF